MRAIVSLVNVQLGHAAKESWLREAQGLPSQAAYAIARADANRAMEAVVVLEQGRAYLLTEALERERADLAALQQTHPAVHQQYRDAAERAAMLEAQEARLPHEPRRETPPSGFDHAAEARAVRAKLNAAIEAIRQVPGYASFLKPPTFEDIRMTVAPIADGGCVVYLATIEQGSMGFIAYANEGEPVKAVWLNFTEANLVSLLVRRSGGVVVGGMLPAQIDDPRELPVELVESLPTLSRGLIAPLAVELRALGLTQVFLIPSGLLNLLPLHAVSYEVDGANRYFGDEFTVSYAPNARALLAARRELSNREGATSLTGVGNPLPHPKPLVAAEAELEEVAELFARRFGATNHTTLLREKATKAALLKDLPEAGYVHLACHGGFDANAPLESALQLANGELLTLSEVLYGKAKPLLARLVTLSACQTGISDFNNLPDEYIGLLAGFLQTGVPGVMGTLWPVEDLSTALLMSKFYELHLFGDKASGSRPLPPAEALASAQRWLRELTNRELLEYFAGQRPVGTGRINQQADAMHARFPAQLITEKLQKLRRAAPGRCPYSHSYFWAPFIFIGV
jgi:CHAT domain-containing protein